LRGSRARDAAVGRDWRGRLLCRLVVGGRLCGGWVVEGTVVARVARGHVESRRIGRIEDATSGRYVTAVMLEGVDDCALSAKAFHAASIAR